MSVHDSEPEIPTWLTVTLLALVGVGAVYSIVLGIHLPTLAVGLLWLFGIAVGLFVVSLFWRFVLAVERIADKR